MQVENTVNQQQRDQNASRQRRVAHEGADAQAAEQAGATAIGLLLSKMDADELLATMETVFKYVTCDGKRVEINATFAGRNKELWQVFIAALRFNFSDFLPAGLFASVQSAVTK